MKTKLVLAAAVLTLGATAAMAGDDRRLNIPRDQWLTPAQITTKLTDQGYRVTEIESDDGAYEVEMVSKDGVRIETHVHPATGEMMHGWDD